MFGKNKEFLSISEIQGRADFGDLLTYGLNPLLLEGANEEPSVWEEIFTPFPLTRNNIPFPSYKGLVVGKIVEGQEIPFVSLGTGTQTITAEDYGVRAGYTRQMLRDDLTDVMRYTTQELGRAHTRTKNKVAIGALVASAGATLATDEKKLNMKMLKICEYEASAFKEVGTNIPRPVAYDTLVMNPKHQWDFTPGKVEDAPVGAVYDLNTGRLTGVLGLKVVITNWCPADEVILCKAKDRLLYCEREGLTLDRTERFETAAEEVRTLEAYTFAILDGDNVYRIKLDDATATSWDTGYDWLD